MSTEVKTAAPINQIELYKQKVKRVKKAWKRKSLGGTSTFSSLKDLLKLKHLFVR